jgi:CubicO group peptidase (beta-lactamase class C family)
MTEASGLSPSRLARLHDTMAGYVERKAMPGIVTVISRRGEVHIDAIGNLAFETDSSQSPPAMEPDSIFRIASLSKPVTAVAAMMLVEECVLRLDDPVERFLPELADRQVLRSLESAVDDTVPAKRPITLRDLLTFRFGFGVIMAPPGTYPIQDALAATDLRNGPPNPQEQPEPNEWIRQFATLPLLHQPGERWMYDMPVDVLTVLIGRASGQRFEDFLRERIFEPLGMKDTAFYVPAEKSDRFATQYAPCDDGSLQILDPPVGGQWSTPPAFPSGAAGLVSTAEDFLAFGHMMLNKGRYGRIRLLARPTVELMTTDQLTDTQKAFGGLLEGDFDSSGFGFGVSVATRRDDLCNVPGRFGWTGGLGTSWYADPAEDLTAILLTQCLWTSPAGPDVNRDFWTGVYQSIDD